MSLRSTSALMAVLVILSVPTLPQASEVSIIQARFAEDESGSERINYSGKLRMLSQRIPAAACNVHAGIETDAAKQLMNAATKEFDLIIHGLSDGEPKLNIKGAETDRKIKAELSNLGELWGPLRDEIESISTDGGTFEELTTLAQSSHDVLEVAKKLVSEISGEYADPAELTQANALSIDIAGRQRMLAQRMSKNVCLIASGLDVERATQELAAARTVYDASLRALRFGNTNAGIAPTKNAEILSGLDDILELWESMQPKLDLVAAGSSLDAETRALVFHAMNSLTGQMNTLVGIYDKDSKQGV